jgi:hypothetical protein
VWRIAELDPAIGPGSVVRVPGYSGLWRVESWEWRDCGVELDLRRLPRSTHRRIVADAGEVLAAPDLVATPTHLAVFELPWDGLGSSDARQVYAAASSESSGWKGAALYRNDAGNLVPIGTTGTRRSVVGSTLKALGRSPGLMLERAASLDVQLVSEDFVLVSASIPSLANGSKGHPAGAGFVLLDDTLVPLDAAQLGGTAEITVAAIGLADQAPVLAQLASPGESLRPLSPVHARSWRGADGALILQWARRARGAWTWENQLPTPLVEPTESYVVGLGDVDQPVLRWEVSQPRLELGSSLLASFPASHSGLPLWVQQLGLHGLSEPLLLGKLP